MIGLAHRIFGLLAAFAILSALYGVIARCWPSVRGQKVFRRGFATDCVYWLWTPLITNTLAMLALALALAPLARLFGLRLETLALGHGLAAKQPLGLQGAEVFVLGDFLGYWQHRLFHTKRLWRFHAVHHSSRELDWLSSVRLHPVNDIGAKLIPAIPLVVVGFNLTTIALYAPLATFYAIMVHANVSWDLGPLRTVFVSPAFHRWHHTKALEGQDKNFAGALPVWDIMFGTFYLPRRQPVAFGIDEPMPENFIGQLIEPFRPAQRGLAGPRGDG